MNLTSFMIAASNTEEKEMGNGARTNNYNPQGNNKIPPWIRSFLPMIRIHLLVLLPGQD